MNYKLILSNIALILVIALSAEAQVRFGGSTLVTPTASWDGYVKNKALLSSLPRGGFITDSKTFATLCKTWAPKTTIPKIDFEKEIILVRTSPGPGRTILKAFKDRQGNVTILDTRSKLGGAGFTYKIVSITRGKIQKVNGIKLPAGKNDTTVLIGKGGKQKNYVKVTMRGDLTTVVSLVPPRSKGSIITANGITYELDFGTKTTLRDQVIKLDGKKVLMSGTLSLKGTRRVVAVESIYLVP